MKPRHLTICAFGPYGGTEEVDFSSLPTDRPFVISGTTGAGKTSIFDAVCFALFGDLPGHRRRHSEVRSTFAPLSAECSVTFEFEVRGERFRVTRSPSQERAKRRRAGGTTRVHGNARLERLRNGDWTVLARGVRDVSDTCASLLGLDVEQFQRVVLLPQGDFQQVLTASSADREKLLRTLFGTAIYDQAVERLRLERRDLQSRVQNTRSEVAGRLDAAVGLVARAGSLLRAGPLTAGTVTPGSPLDPGVPEEEDPAPVIDLTDAAGEPSDHGEPPDPVQLAAEVDELRARHRGAAELIGRPAADTAAAARSEHAAARAVAARVAERDDARRRREDLEARAAAHAADTARLAAAERAAPVVDAVRRRRDAQERLDGAGVATQEATLTAESAVAATGAGPADDPGGLASPEARAALARRIASQRSGGQQVAAHLDAVGRILGDRSAVEEAADGLRRVLAGHRRTLEVTAADIDSCRGELAGLGSAADDLAEAVTRLASAERLVQEVAERDRRAAELDAALQGEEGATERAALVSARVAEARAELLAVSEVAATAEIARRDLGDVGREVRAAERVGSLATQIGDLERRVEAARGEEGRVFGEFVAQSAPRLADLLVPGEPCVVCGSVEHPHPASPTSSARSVTSQDLERARSAVTVAEERVHAARSEFALLMEQHPGIDAVEEAELVGRLESAEAAIAAAAAAATAEADLTELLARAEGELTRAGNDLEHAAQRVAEARAAHQRTLGALGDATDVTASEAAAALVEAERHHLRCSDAADSVRRVTEQLDRLLAGREEIRLHEAASTEELRSVEGELRRLDADHRRELEAAEGVAAAHALAIPPAGSATRSVSAAELESWIVAARRAVERADAALDALGRLDDAVGAEQRERSLVGEAAAAADTALEESGFSCVAEAEAAAMDSSSLIELRAAVQRWERDLAAADAALAAHDVPDLPEVPPDVDALGEVATEAEASAAAVADWLARIDAHLTSASEVLEAVDHVQGAAAPLEQRLALVGRVHSVLSGEASPQRVTLEAWVLQAHLREVVAAANVHLRAMSHGRFELEVDSRHVDARSKAGLDLAVLDSFSGASRPTASLSGGETFQASLSLALGLADVVTADNAGVQIDALFIDEGFGSLDPDAVDQAVTVLDGLRGRGAMVGVITHVEAMKDALPVVIEVEKRPDHRGSTIRCRV